MLAPALGERGRDLFRAWAGRLFGALAAKLIYAFLLGVVLTLMSLLGSVGGVGWWAQWLLLSAFWWSAFMNRGQLRTVAAAASFVFAGDLAKPSGSDVVHELAYIFAIGVVNLFLAVGLAAIVSSRIVIGVLIDWNSAISHILISFHSFGGARKFIDVAAAEHFQVNNSSDRVAMSTAAAILILAAWAAVFAGLGRYWTERRDA